MPRAQHFHTISEHIDSAVFGDLVRDYERRIFEASVISSAKATAIKRVNATHPCMARAWPRAWMRSREGGRWRGSIPRRLPRVMAYGAPFAVAAAIALRVTAAQVAWRLNGGMSVPCPARTPLIADKLTLDPFRCGAPCCMSQCDSVNHPHTCA